MNEANMRKFLEMKPFLPLTVTLSSGQQIVIDHPENVLLTKTKLVVADLGKDLVSVSPLLHVANVEYTEPATL